MDYLGLRIYRKFMNIYWNARFLILHCTGFTSNARPVSPRFASAPTLRAATMYWKQVISLCNSENVTLLRCHPQLWGFEAGRGAAGEGGDCLQGGVGEQPHETAGGENCCKAMIWNWKNQFSVLQRHQHFTLVWSPYHCSLWSPYHGSL